MEIYIIIVCHKRQFEIVLSVELVEGVKHNYTFEQKALRFCETQI